MMLSD